MPRFPIAAMRLAPALLLLATCPWSAAMAATPVFPDRPVRFIVPFPPGGATDALARIVGQKLTEAWGQQIVIDNRPGAGGNIAAALAARSQPNGYTIFINGFAHVANEALFRKLPYDPVRDFAPIVSLVDIHTFLTVNPQLLPVGSVKELVAAARAKPGQINYGSGGNGSSPHLAMELFKSVAGINLTHIPYKGTESVTAMLANQHPLIFENLLSVGAHVRSGRLRALAVGGRHRSPALPDVPTVAEAGVPGYEVTLWFGVFAPAGTPQVLVGRINAEMVRILKLQDVRERLATAGAEPVGNSPAEFAALVQRERTKWADVVTKAGIRVD